MRIERGSWTDRALQHIEALHAEMPADASIEHRKKVLADSYPFSERRGWAYKSWLKMRRHYLARFDVSYRYPRNNKQIDFNEVLSPLDRAKAKGSKP